MSEYTFRLGVLIVFFLGLSSLFFFLDDANMQCSDSSGMTITGPVIKAEIFPNPRSVVCKVN